MSGGLSTHVLDLARGRPAEGLKVTLKRGDAVLFEGVTNADGRCPDLMPKGALEAGAYALVFRVEDYLPNAFFPVVTIDFVVADPASHHHVPLLLSPFGYSTYRGS